MEATQRRDKGRGSSMMMMGWVFDVGREGEDEEEGRRLALILCVRRWVRSWHIYVVRHGMVKSLEKG